MFSAELVKQQIDTSISCKFLLYNAGSYFTSDREYLDYMYLDTVCPLVRL